MAIKSRKAPEGCDSFEAPHAESPRPDDQADFQALAEPAEPADNLPDSSDAEPDAESENTEQLAGQALLDFYAAEKAKGRSHAEIAHDAGYFSVTKNNLTRVNLAQFNQAYLEASGVDTGGKSSSGAGRSHAGRERARVSGQGILLVSQLATRSIGAIPGAVFTVEYPTGEAQGAGAQILLTLTDQIDPIVTRKSKADASASDAEQPGTPLLDQIPDQG